MFGRRLRDRRRSLATFVSAGSSSLISKFGLGIIDHVAHRRILLGDRFGVGVVEIVDHGQAADRFDLVG